MSNDVFDHLFSPAQSGGLFQGVAIGVVSNTKDPETLGRVKVKLPWLAADAETDWVRVTSVMAGSSRGLFFPLEMDDEVLVAFEHGSPQRPFVIGALWNGRDKPPDSNADGKNNIRMIKSRSGHVIRLTDTGGAEKIEILDKSAKNTIVIDTAKNTVTITADADLTIESKTGKLTLKGKDVEIVAQASLKAQANGSAEVKANTTLTLKGTAAVNIN